MDEIVRKTSSTSSVCALSALACGQLLECFRVHGRVLADLELGEVEPEGLDLPDELLQVSVGLPRRAGRVQRVLDDPQVREELLRVAVGQIRVAAAGRGDPPGDEQQRAPVRLARRALGDVDGGFLVARGEALEQRLQRRARRRGDHIEREGAADAVRGALQSQQDVLARDLRGLAGDGCRHERVAVAVAADPRADADERLARSVRASPRRAPAGRRRRGGTRAGPR